MIAKNCDDLIAKNCDDLKAKNCAYLLVIMKGEDARPRENSCQQDFLLGIDKGYIAEEPE